MDPIKEIIEKLKNEHGENGSWFVLKSWYEIDFKKPKRKNDTYEDIYGFLYGLYAVGYISKTQKKIAIDYLIEMYKKI